MTKLLDKYLIKIDRDKWIIAGTYIKISYDGYRTYLAYIDSEFGGINEICYMTTSVELKQFLISQGIEINE